MVVRLLACAWFSSLAGLAGLAGLAVLAACGSTTPVPVTNGDMGGPVKKISLSWGITTIGASSEVFLAVTDQNGRATSHPLGRFDGECAVISGGRPSTGAATAVLCKRGDFGVELDAIPRSGVIIVLRIPYTAGAETDPLSGQEIAHIAVPVDAKIEASN